MATRRQAERQKPKFHEEVNGCTQKMSNFALTSNLSSSLTILFWTGCTGYLIASHWFTNNGIGWAAL